MLFLADSQEFAASDRLLSPVFGYGIHHFLIVGHALFGKDYITVLTDNVDCPLHQFTHRFQGLVILQDLAVRIGQNRESKALFVAIIVMRFNRGRIDGQYFGAERFEFFPVRLKGG